MPIFGSVDAACPHCAMEYRALKTGLTFAAVRQLMYTGPDVETWRRKRRGSVLGYWRELKVTAWRTHIEECPSRVVELETVPF